MGAVSQSKLIDLTSEISRQNTLIQASRQDLLTGGLTPQQVQQIESGTFVSTVDVVAPPVSDTPLAVGSSTSPVELASYSETAASALRLTSDSIAYEVQELAVELGQQVQAGQLLANLSNHQSLYVVGHAFKREAAYLEQAAQENLPIEIEFEKMRPTVGLNCSKHFTFGTYPTRSTRTTLSSSRT